MAKVKKKEKEEVEQSSFETETVQPPKLEKPETPPAISVSELQSMLRIINTATERGAFRGNELSIVGSLHDKLTQFIYWVAENQTTSNEDEENDNG